MIRHVAQERRKLELSSTVELTSSSFLPFSLWTSLEAPTVREDDTRNLTHSDDSLRLGKRKGVLRRKMEKPLSFGDGRREEGRERELATKRVAFRIS